MAYGKIKADTFVYDNSGSDTEITVASLGAKASLPASAGTVGASEVVQVDANKDTTGIRNLTISGNLQVNGTTTTVASSTMTVTDKNIEIAKGAANDAAADGGGITLESGDGNKEIKWVNATDSWTFNQDIEVTTGDITIKAGDGLNATLHIFADRGDDNADKWRLESNVTGEFKIQQYSSGSWATPFTLNGSNNATFAGSLDAKYLNGTQGGNTLNQKLRLSGSGVTTGDDFTINNWGDAEGDYWHIGVNSTSDASGNSAKTNDVKRSVGLTLDGRMGRMQLQTSQTNTSTRDTTHTWDRSGNYIATGTVSDSKGDLRKIIQNTQGSTYTLVAADAGKHILASGNITVPDSVFSAGDAVTIINNTGSNLTITKGTNMYNAGDASNANRTLATRGMATLLFTAADTSYISGAGLS